LKIIPAIGLMVSVLMGSVSAQPFTITESEAVLRVFGDSILKGSNDSVRIYSSVVFKEKFREILKSEKSFIYSFDSLKNVSTLNSSDGIVRVYTWIVPLFSNGKISYSGFIQAKDKKSGKIHLLELNEGEFNRQHAEKKSYDYKNWIGALYYKLITSKSKGEVIYTLLGWRGNDNNSNYKIIDVLKIKNGKAMFGSPVFQTDKGMRHRIIFEYNRDAVMTLNYDDKKKMIVFDHLSPPDTAMAGNFSSYGPDFTYDGFRFSKGKWKLLKNIEPRNPRDNTSSPADKIQQNKEFYKPEK